VIRRNVENVLPFITTENLLMEAVKRGGDRQQLHELIRVCSMEAAARMNRGGDCDLLRRLAEHPEFCLSGQELEALLVPENYVGRAPEQVSAFLENHRTLWETDRPCGENP
jgi:adenylosuccinate lyase